MHMVREWFVAIEFDSAEHPLHLEQGLKLHSTELYVVIAYACSNALTNMALPYSNISCINYAPWTII